MPDDEEACFLGGDTRRDHAGLFHEKARHGLMVASGFAIMNDAFPDTRGFAGELEFAGNHRLGEIPLTDKIRHHINLLAIDHAQDFAEGGLLFPEAYGHLGEDAALADALSMNERRGTRVGIHCRAMAHDDKGALREVFFHWRRSAQTLAASKCNSAYARAAFE